MSAHCHHHPSVLPRFLASYASVPITATFRSCHHHPSVLPRFLASYASAPITALPSYVRSLSSPYFGSLSLPTHQRPSLPLSAHVITILRLSLASYISAHHTPTVCLLTISTITANVPIIRSAVAGPLFLLYPCTGFVINIATSSVVFSIAYFLFDNYYPPLSIIGHCSRHIFESRYS